MNGAIIEHWNGMAWKIAASPQTFPLTSLKSISAISATDIWAVGCDQCGDFSNDRPALVEHWNGKRWKLITTPTETFGVAGNAVLTFPSKHIVIGGFIFAPTGPSSVIFEGVEGQ